MTFHRGMTFLAALVMSAVPSILLANDDICLDIQRRLTGGSLMIGNSVQTREAIEAINEQNAYIRQIRTDMRRNGCSIGSVIVYGNRNAQLCGELGDILIEARADLDYLTSRRQQQQLTRQMDLHYEERRALEDAWDDYGCVNSASLRPDSGEPLPPPTLNPIPAPAPLSPPVTIIDPSNKPTTQGALRTMCVRSCDGKFFPISSHASPLDFASQAQQCQRACPAAQTELFYHALVGQESKDMVSASSGAAYSSLPNAYRFQSSTPPGQNSCGCGPQGSVEFGEKPQIVPAPQKRPEAPSPGSAAQPVPPKITPQSLPAQTAQSEQPTDEGRPYSPDDRPVRTVGPQFFPQDSSIDLSKPALRGAQPQQ